MEGRSLSDQCSEITLCQNNLGWNQLTLNGSGNHNAARGLYIDKNLLFTQRSLRCFYDSVHFAVLHLLKHIGVYLFVGVSPNQIDSAQLVQHMTTLNRTFKDKNIVIVIYYMLFLFALFKLNAKSCSLSHLSQRVISSLYPVRV